jgi:hypothetical protein
MHDIHVIHRAAWPFSGLRDSHGVTPSLSQSEDGAAGNQSEINDLDPVSGVVRRKSGDKRTGGRKRPMFLAKDHGALSSDSCDGSAERGSGWARQR